MRRTSIGFLIHGFSLKLGQPDTIPVHVLPSGSIAARHRKGVTAERFILILEPYVGSPPLPRRQD
ncbi:hypothetical protein T265_06208 [Opisthorchis viverrini]|uniref:Uncharacterized protein n=1 Tax=Opisthorchis viverrini TaxID=6198 RepID=A0A075AE87_OPIVI|nr:hypothetical protein T265_06208 [Opisthorchis viverrini]KER26564.1 hypothetical protein T265_06208 [Opisthorchis viverrini]